MTAYHLPENVDREAFVIAVQHACYSADTVAVEILRDDPHTTGAEKTRAVIERALEALLANGAITLVPVEDLPDYYVPDPPYKGFE